MIFWDVFLHETDHHICLSRIINQLFEFHPSTPFFHQFTVNCRSTDPVIEPSIKLIYPSIYTSIDPLNWFSLMTSTTSMKYKINLIHWTWCLQLWCPPSTHWIIYCIVLHLSIEHDDLHWSPSNIHPNNL